MLPTAYANEFISADLLEQIYLLRASSLDHFDLTPLRTCLGNARLNRLCHHDAIQAKPVNNGVSEKEFQALLVGVGLVFSDDVRELWAELRDETQERVRHLSMQQTKNLRATILNDDADQDPAVIDQLMEILIPVNDIETLMPTDITYQDKSQTTKTCGQGYLGLQAIVWTLNRCRLLRQNTADADQVLEYCYQLYSKRLVDLEPPTGVMIAHPQGWYVNFDPIYGTYPDNHGTNVLTGGHYIMPLKAMTQGLMNGLLCRGTRVQMKATDHFAACAENLRTCQGAQIKLALDPIQELLSEPARGFIKDASQPVRIIGMSLGGAHAARLAIAFYEKVHECILIASVGLDRPSLDYYATVVNQSDLAFIPIVKIIANPLDNVPFLGNGHLGLNCDSTKIQINITWLSLEENNNVNWPEAFIELTLPPVKSALRNTNISAAHTLVEYQYPVCFRRTVNNQDHPLVVNLMLNNASDRRARFEESRRVITQKLPFGDEFEFVRTLQNDFHPTQDDRLKQALKVHQEQFKALRRFNLDEVSPVEYQQRAALHRWWPTRDCILPKRFGHLVRRFAALQNHASLNAWLSHYAALLQKRPLGTRTKDKAGQISQHSEFHKIVNEADDQHCSPQSLFQRLIQLEMIDGGQTCLIELIATPRTGAWSETRFAKGFDTLLTDFPVLKAYEQLLRQVVVLKKKMDSLIDQGKIQESDQIRDLLTAVSVHVDQIGHDAERFSMPSINSMSL